MRAVDSRRHLREIHDGWYFHSTGQSRRGCPRFGLLWAVKRALLGIAILVVMFGGGAWLMYETIEPDRADAREVGGATLETSAPSAKRPAATVNRQ